MTTPKEMAAEYIGAYGPVGFAGIWAHCKEQCTEPQNPDNYIVAAALNELLREGKVELYDDGTSFVSGPAV